MDEVIYSKFSNDRAEDFAIVTEIVRGLGKKYVRKRALTSKSTAHIRKQAEYYCENKDAYKASGYILAPCIMKEEALVYKYIKGKSLSEDFSDIYISNRGKYVDAVNDYCHSIKKLLNQNVKWTVTDSYMEIFRIDDQSMYQKSSCDFANIDLIPDNIIINDKKKYIIDYEWTFDFPIPIDYVIYRIIRSICEGKDDKLIQTLYSQNDISPHDYEIYSEMEKNFQEYILKGNTTVTNLYQYIGKKVYNINDYIVMIEKNKQINEVQFFYDDGSGFSEERKCTFYETEGQYKVLLPVGIRRLRIDPCSHSCVISSVTIDDQVYCKNELYRLDSNAIMLDEDLIFCSEDPQIILDTNNASEIKIQIEYSKAQDVVKRLKDSVCKIENLTSDKKLEMNIEHTDIIENEAGQKEIYVAGWMFMLDINIDTLYIISDNKYQKAVYGSERKDVSMAYPDVEGALNSGFSFNLKDTGMREPTVHLIMYSNGMPICAKKITIQGDK